MEALPAESNRNTPKKGLLAEILTLLALIVIVAAALTFIGLAEAILPGSYSIIASLSVLLGVFLVARTLVKNFDPKTTEALAASIAPNAAAAAAAAAAPRNAEAVAEDQEQMKGEDEPVVPDTEGSQANPK